MIKFAPWLLVVVVLSCARDNKQQHVSTGLQMIPSKGIWQHPDSFEKPVSVPAGPPDVLPATRPTVTLHQHDPRRTAPPLVLPAGHPRVCTPGQDTFPLPKSFTAFSKVQPVGIPEVIAAKDMANKDHNPANFNFFKLLQGLKHNSIRCLFQDKTGNLWFGTNGGGITRYDGKSFTHFTEKQGLVNNMVYSMKQDQSGNLWLGTNGGISRYDGKTFTNFTNKQIFTNSLMGLLEDSKGNFWFASFGDGVFRYDGKVFTQFTQKEGLANNIVTAVLEDKHGHIWFGTQGGLSRYDGTSFANYTEEEGLVNNSVNSLLEDNRGHLWLGTNDGISRFDGNSFTNFTGKQGLGNGQVISMLQDNRGDFWFGTYNGGLARFDGKSFTNFTDADGLLNNFVFSLLQDNTGSLWLGTNIGLARYDGQRFHFFGEKEGLAARQVWSILQDNTGHLWFGTDGGGVSRYDGNNFVNFSDKPGVVNTNNIVWDILQDKSGAIWFGNNTRGVSRYDGSTMSEFTSKQGLPPHPVVCVFEDSAGNLWLGTSGGGAVRYDGRSFTAFTTRQGLPRNDVFSILQDKQGKLWFGTFGGGLSCYDGKSFTNFTDKEGLANNDVFSLLQDQSGVLWIGTNGGVSRYDGNCFVNFTEKEGLANNGVLSLLQDRKGNIWLGTRKGLSKITPSRLANLSAYLGRRQEQKQTQPGSSPHDTFDALQQGLFYNYDYSDGFLGVNCRRNAVVEDRDGRIWWATDVLTCYTPEGDRADTIAPVVQLNSVKLFGEEIAWARLGAVSTDSSGRETLHETSRDTVLGNGVLLHDIRFDSMARWYPLPQHLSLPYNNNNLTFNFIGVHMQSRNHVKYQYQLQGLEDNWSVITERSEAHYGNLPPGDYTFQVKAMNQSGVWSSPFQFIFEVRPPWWQTWWFRALVLVSGVAAIWGYIRSLEIKIAEATLEIKESHREIKEQKQVIEERHKEITDSINYAERIQRSFLASQEHLDQHLAEYFIFFRPKEVVSGDFYWSATLNNGLFAIVCADSTGHGVPGAIMSLLNVTSLERAIEMETEPHKILHATRKIIIERLNKDGSADGGKDGMDGSLLSFDFKNNMLYCATANNPVCIIRNNQLIEVKSDRIPIGKHERDQEPFTLHTLQLQKGDLVYAFTDGFSDQFGGSTGKKFKYKKLLELLLSMTNESMATQKQKLTEVFNEWKGSFEQVDDVTVIGVRI